MGLARLAAAALGTVLVSAAAAAERGRDGHLGIVYWQAPSILNPYISGGTKDVEAASMILEPLARYDESGNLVPWLAASVPTVANGGVSADLRTVTWRLREGLLWSDGSPVTAADVAFTATYCRDPAGGCSQRARFDDVTSAEALDDLTVRVAFGVPKPYPYGPFAGAASPILQKAQFAGCRGTRAAECAEANSRPVGTGPFRVTEFRPNGTILLEANPHYRDPAKPAFATVTFKGGGDAVAAARAVLVTGAFDYASNLQLAPEVLRGMRAAGRGTVVSGFGTVVERLVVNLTDPSPERGGARSTRAHPHPFLTDRAVRRALSMAIDRKRLVVTGYGEAGRPTCNVVPAPEIYASTANDGCLVQDIEGAKRLLDAAGWQPGPDGVRQRDGVRLSVLFQTSTNAVRQAFQALIGQWWSEIGVATELRDIDASVFFGGDPGSPDTYQKFFADIEMYASGFEGADPESHLGAFRCDNEPRPASRWRGGNVPRYCSDAYDRLLARMAVTGDVPERARIGRALNDMLVQDHVLIPLVHRGRVSAHARSLGGVRLNTWDSQIWNIADWHRSG